LSHDLTSQELSALFSLLTEKQPEDHSQLGHVFKNDLMDLLCSQTIPSAQVFTSLSEVFDDPEQDPVLRDYALQHLAMLYERLDEPAITTVPALQAQRNAIQEHLWAALTEVHSSIAGTALLALSRLANHTHDFDPEKIAAESVTLASNSEASELVRITALQVGANYQLKELVPLASSLATTHSNRCLRISAIATLGSIGGGSDLPLIQALIVQGDPRLTAVAALARERIRERIGDPQPRN
jgi:hypothetical protein